LTTQPDSKVTHYARDLIDPDLIDPVRALPKIELHRHLEGAVRLETLVEIAQQHGIEMPEYAVETLRPFVQMMPNEFRSSQNFLAKFHTIRQFFLSPAVISRVTREAVEDAAADNIRYMELRFTPYALGMVCRYPPQAVISWVAEAAAEAAAAHGIIVRLIVSVNRHESVEIAEKVYKAALLHRDQGVVALDLAGNEAQFPTSPFLKLFRKAKNAGLGITLHAGEWGGAANVWDAVGNFGADRVGHGVRVLEDPGLVEVLAERGTVLEVCPTSNVHSGVVNDYDGHPLPVLIEKGLKVTLNTDDPLVCAVTLSEEIGAAVSRLSTTFDDIRQYTLLAARAAFLPEDEKAALITRFEAWFGMSGVDGSTS
jgi:adenosine deaminase